MNCNTGNSSNMNMHMREDMHYCLDRLPVAMAYVPWQTFGRTFDLDHALQTGTIFPELNKPFYGCGGNCR